MVRVLFCSCSRLAFFSVNEYSVNSPFKNRPHGYMFVKCKCKMCKNGLCVVLKVTEVTPPELVVV